MKNHEIKYLDFGVSEYKETWDRQEELLSEIVRIKRDNDNLPKDKKIQTPNWIIFVEHPHVYTLGKSGNEANLLLNYVQLQGKNASFFRTDRGGDITYHGPGQIVGYPILDLENFGMGLRQYIYTIEEAIIRAVAEYGIIAGRDTNATGVWVDAGRPEARKICAIGVKSSRFVTMHGFALNINTDLEYFNYINPCGFKDKSVTSVEKEVGQKQDFKKAKKIVLTQLSKLFDASIV